MPDIEALKTFFTKKSKKKPVKKTETLEPRKTPELGEESINEELFDPPKEKKTDNDRNLT